CYPVHLPAMPQLRKIARIDGMSLIGSGEAGVYREDSVGVAADWRKLAESWETPYGALVPKSIRGALAAGRCISSAGEAWEIFRVIPAAAMTGEAAGVAASICCERNLDPAELPVNDLQQELLANGVILHIADGRDI
ncbi:MAG: FAD-dependent oxidoreductase, partial [Lentisphaeria bacterium]|nr:FAD-dependent oxidoreductase [Lentisphaeria bacterium]